jgi:3-oxoacyl-[acyl-carrier-protein] synthase II
MNRRVVVTGVGLITPLGTGIDETWQRLRSRQSAVQPVSRFDASAIKSQIAAEIDRFDPLDHMDRKRSRRLDRFSQLAVASSRMSLAHAGLEIDRNDGRGVGVNLGSALGGVAYGETQHEQYMIGGLRAVQPSLALAVFGGAGATNVAIEFGLKGPALGNANSCASGANAIGDAYRMIKRGEIDVMLAGGVEAPLSPLVFGAFALINALSTRNDDPAHASRPFDRDRDGFVMSEGASMLVLETLERAISRGREPLAEIVGYGATNDAYHMTAPRPDGSEAARAMEMAMHEAGVSPREIDYLNTHSTATPLGDAAEARAIATAFGDTAPAIPVSGTKGYYGHALGASGAIEAAICVLAMQRGWLPPTINLDEPSPDICLNLITGAGLDHQPDIVMSNSFGFGGINTSMIFRRL